MRFPISIYLETPRIQIFCYLISSDSAARIEIFSDFILFDCAAQINTLLEFICSNLAYILGKHILIRFLHTHPYFNSSRYCQTGMFVFKNVWILNLSDMNARIEEF